jgi:hypothetical protein
MGEEPDFSTLRSAVGLDFRMGFRLRAALTKK